MPEVIKICTHCGKKYAGKNKTTYPPFCQKPECRKEYIRYYNKSNHTKGKVTKQCAHCKENYEGRPTVTLYPPFCQKPECRKEYRRFYNTHRHLADVKRSKVLISEMVAEATERPSVWLRAWLEGTIS